MSDRRKGTYALLLALAAALTALYADRRDLCARYVAHQEAVRQVQAGHEACEQLERDIESSRRQIEHLGTDPIEIEAAIRRSQDLVREGERIYRIEVVPNPAP